MQVIEDLNFTFGIVIEKALQHCYFRSLAIPGISKTVYNFPDIDEEKVRFLKWATPYL